jgi:TatD DNase family protein
MYIDSHCHLDRVDLRPYGGDFAQLMAATSAAGVSRMLCVGIDLERYPAMRALVDPYPQVGVSVGVHPNAEGGGPPVAEPTVEGLAALAADPRVLAIGETGLDFYYGRDNQAAQRARFRTQIAAARLCRKPLVVHTRDARAETIAVLREEGARHVGGVLHCFTEDWETAKEGLDLGFYVSFSGILTFRNAEPLRDVARRVPLDRLLIETDAPYLAPVPHRGKSNEPRHVEHVAACMASVRGTTQDSIAEATAENFLRLFGQPESASG